MAIVWSIVVLGFGTVCHNLATVIHLFFMSGPSAIARFIVAFVVDAIKRAVYRPSTHIAEKVLKFFPSGANSDSAPAITLPRVVVLIRATLNHMLPRYVGWGAFVSSIVAVLRMQFGIAAPTAHCNAPSELIDSSDNSCIAAIAIAFPIARMFRKCYASCDQLTETTT